MVAISNSGRGICASMTLVAFIATAIGGGRDASAQNAIVLENALQGNPPAEWEVSGAGHDSIQGFGTDISVDQGQTIAFKIDTASTDYRIDIYRLGYYAGLGARLVDTIQPSATLPQSQPACIFDDDTNLLDCGNWAVSASWVVPADATSGIYLARLVREDSPNEGLASHIAFVVRDDDGGSDILFQTSDTTWQAYNTYSDALGPCNGANLYFGGPDGKASKVSYNRPFSTRGCVVEDWLFNAEYPMVRFLERNGYDVSYFTNVDADRNGAEILEHELFISVGHDEYWSRGHRDNVTDARDAGVHLAFFSGNECYWKVRWEDSVDGSNTPYRTMVCYKEGTLGENNCGGKCDPLPDVWTGLWRDGCAFPLADGCEPENSLSGQISWIGSTAAITVPGIYGILPFWRNTTIETLPSNQTAILGTDTLGYEWNPYQPLYDATAPPGLIWLSSTSASGNTHHLSIYQAPGGAIVFGAGTVQWSWGLDSVHDRGSAPPDDNVQQATVNLLADMGIQPETLQGTLEPGFPTGPDGVPPIIIGRTPAVDAVNVPITTAVTVTFNEPVQAVTIDLTLRDSSLNLVSANVAYSSLTRTATLTPLSPLLEEELYTATLAGVRDLANNLLTTTAWSFTTEGPPVCPCSIFGSTAPAGSADGDTNAIELGVKFRSTSNGYALGIRFYKMAANTGTHIGHLWAANGDLLGTVTFSGETASGWQEALFGAPIAITADTTYIASYHAPVGRYAFDGGYFAAGGVDNPPLRALGNGEDGPNGVYNYGPAGIFPATTFNASNYWVDALFDFTAVDETPPVVVARTPSANANGVSASTNVTATFNESVVEASIDFELRDSGDVTVPSVFSYDAPSRTATLNPNADLQYNATYTASIIAEDLAANDMLAAHEWSFTTGSPPPPPPDEGPGGPILVVAHAANPFGRYYAEILRNEGFNYFNVTDVSQVTAAVLDDYEVVILGEMALSGAQATMLSDWVTAGGKLIAMRPDPQLEGLLGLTPAGAPLAEGYLLVNTASAPGQGIVGQTIQYHSAANLYTLNGASSIATLYANANTPTASPAVTLRAVGPNGGRAAAFAYDLARSVVYTRQGNPAWAGTERDGISPIRSDDQFFPDWIDFDKVAIPQADEQQRLLANLILQLAGHPWPRFWYLPSFHKAAVIMTGDQHGCCGATAARFQVYLDQSPLGCSLDDWECVRASSYVYPGGGMTDAEGLAWHNLGFELGIHTDTGCANWTEATLDALYTSQLAVFAAQFPSLPVQDSERTHCIAFSTWAGQPLVKIQHGIRLDTNYYYWPPSWVQNRPGMFTGSGMVMRFADLDGTMIDVYQAASQMTDESGQSYPFTIDTLLDRALGPEGYYGAFCANMHTDSSPHAGSDAIVGSALARGVPVVSGRQMLVWLDGRNASTYSALDWTGSTLSFTVSVGVGANNLRGMVPATAAAGTLESLTRNAAPVVFITETIKGIEYAIFDAQPGNYAATYAPDTTPPVITSLAAVPDNDGTAEITWTTNEPADSLVEYGTSPGSLVLSASSATLVTAHGISLSGLLPDTTYYYRATSADEADNPATEPPPLDAPASFTTPGPSCAEDVVAADFAAGTPGAGTYVSATLDGEVILTPTEGAEFFGVAMPVGWETVPWAGGGGAVVAGGSVAVDGARIDTTGLYAPGRSVEFVATFAAAANQHAGFAVDFNAPPWAMFSTMGGPDTLFARTSAGGDTSLGLGYVGSPHRYRIDWNANSITFFIDGTLVATHNVAMAASMRPIASDFIVGGLALSVDWIRMTPYAASGSFDSRIFNAGTAVNWGAVTWSSVEPAGTALAIYVRRGNSPVPDGTWSPYALIPFNGAIAGGNSQFIQYSADLATGDTLVTPALEDLTISCAAGGDVTPPQVLAVTPLAGAIDVARSTNVTATFSEPMNAGTIDGATLNLAPSGGGPAVPAAVTYTPGNLTATLDPDSDLASSTTYVATVTTGAKDLAGNGLATDEVWMFTTVASDVTSPSVIARSPSPGATGVLIASAVTATFNEAMNAPTINGATFTLTPIGGSPVSATVSYIPGTFTATLDPDSDLAMSTTYDALVTTGVQDAAGNGLAANVTWTFTTQAPVCVADDLYNEFGAGSPGLDTYVAATGDGEVILAPIAGAEFQGPGLDPGWASFNWPGGGSTIIAGGQVTLDGAKVRDATFHVAPRRLEFVATFNAAAFQHVGFGAGSDTPPSDTFSVFPFAIFSTGSGGTALMARVGTAGGSLTEFTLPGSFLGAPHQYRLDWNVTSFDFYVDGALLQTIAVAVPEAMRAAASDLFNGGPTLSVNWIRMAPYSDAGTFESRIFDALTPADWDIAAWTSSEPAGTSIDIFVRTGNTPVPDGTWSPYALILNPGDPVAGTSRYLQYRADLATSDTNITPQLQELTVGCTPQPDIDPPVISNIVATPTVDGTGATITWDTDEPADSLVVYGISPGSLPSSGSSAAMVFSHAIPLTGLTPDTTYYYRVSSKDAEENAATSPNPPADPLSFTTPVPVCLADDTTADFGAGTLGAGAYLAESADGEVILAPTEGAEFFGGTLPAGWEVVQWTPPNGAATVSGGSLSVDGVRANTAAPAAYGPGRSIEFVATFGAAEFQHVGMAVDFSAPQPWVMFSTANSTNTLFARSFGAADISLGVGYIGAPHRYRIDWNVSSVEYFIDGVSVAVHGVAVAGPLRPIVSDFNAGGAAVSVNWIRMTPYSAAGTFESRIVDAGTSVGWDQAQWTADVPPGTSLGISVRTGQTPVPDGSWQPYEPIAESGDVIGLIGRYAQYRAELASTIPAATPVLHDVSLSCGTNNLAPVADDDERSVVQGDPVVIDVLANDVDGDGSINPATVAIALAPLHGTITNINILTGEITYEHDGSPIATDSFRYTVKDNDGFKSNQATVLLEVVHEVTLSIQLAGVVSSISRCIRFEVFECGGASEVVTKQVAFTGGQAAGVRLEVPLANYDCISARDTLHTLARVDPGFTSVDGIHYSADFTDQTGGGGADQALVGGNANGDNFVDIFDFGLFTGQWNATYPPPSCATLPPQADFSGNNTVFTEDFTFIANNFLEEGDDACCAPIPAGAGPVAAISVAELNARGLGLMAAGDLNGDGWLDQMDMVAFLFGERPKPQPPAGGAPDGAFVLRFDGADWFNAGAWRAGEPPDQATDVILPVTVVIRDGSAVARSVRVVSGGKLRLIGGTLAAESLTVERGGTLELRGSKSFLKLESLVLEQGAALDWRGGVIEISGLFEQAEPDLVVGGNGRECTLRLTGGAEAHIARDTIIGAGSGGFAVLEVVASTFTTGRSLLVGVGGSGAVQLDDGTLGATRVLAGRNGAISGSGLIAADVTGGGVVSPGDGAGTLLIEGDYRQNANGVVEINAAPAGAGLFEMTGQAHLAGRLVVRAGADFAPRPGDEIAIVSAARIKGRFDLLDLPDLPGDIRWVVMYRNGEVVLGVSGVAAE